MHQEWPSSKIHTFLEIAHRSLLDFPSLLNLLKKTCNVKLSSTGESKILKYLLVVYFHGEQSDMFFFFRCFELFLSFCSLAELCLFSSCHRWAPWFVCVCFFLVLFEPCPVLTYICCCDQCKTFCLHGNTRWERKSFTYLQSRKMLPACLRKSKRPAPQTFLRRKPKKTITLTMSLLIIFLAKHHKL